MVRDEVCDSCASLVSARPPSFEMHLLLYIPHSTFQVTDNLAPNTLHLAPCTFHFPSIIPLHAPSCPSCPSAPLCLDSQSSGFLIQLSSLEGAIRPTRPQGVPAALTA